MKELITACITGKILMSINILHTRKLFVQENAQIPRFFLFFLKKISASQ